MMPLGHQLRTDDQIELPLLDIAQGIAEQEPTRQVARQHADARLWKAQRRLFRQPLDARPHRHHLALSLAMRAGLRHRLQMPAMVAHQLAPEAMLDQRGSAVGAFQPVPAGPAQGQRRIAAAVQEQQRLIARRQRLRQLFDQRRRQPGAGFQLHHLHVDEADLRQFRPPVPVFQLDQPVAPAVDIDE